MYFGGAVLQSPHLADAIWDRQHRYCREYCLNLSMALKPFVSPHTAGKAIDDSNIVGITKQGFYFPAAFLKEYKLEKKEGILFFLDEEDQYVIGVQFLDDSSAPGSYKISLKQFGRRILAQNVFNANPVLLKIQANENPRLQRFPVEFDTKSNLFKIFLRPMFEFKVKWSEKNRIPSDVRGIYRYLDGQETIIYIGKGVIKDRAGQTERANWGVMTIEYSVIPTDQEALRWEKFYLDDFKNEFGALPAMNRISGQSLE
jgi:hypothetical protein